VHTYHTVTTFASTMLHANYGHACGNYHDTKFTMLHANYGHACGNYHTKLTMLHLHHAKLKHT
jgi:hypothetical protein